MALHHAKPGEIVELKPLAEQPQDAKSRALVRTDRFEAIHLILRAGEKIPPHWVAGNLTLHCLEGRTGLQLTSGEKELRAGEWVYLARGEAHAIRGLTDSVLLLTILFDGEREGGSAPSVR